MWIIITKNFSINLVILMLL